MKNKIIKVLMGLCKEEAVMEGRTLPFVIRKHLEKEIFTDNKEIADYMYALVVGQTDLRNFLISIMNSMVIFPELRRFENIKLIKFISYVICKDLQEPENYNNDWNYCDMVKAWSALSEIADGFTESIEYEIDPIRVICNSWGALYNHSKTYECIALIIAIRGLDELKETDTAIYDVRKIVTSIARYWGVVDNIL